MRVLLIASAILYPITLAAAPDYPPYATVTNEKDKDFIQIFCDIPKGSTLSCKFTQIKVRKLGGEEDLAQSLAGIPEMLKEFAEGKAVETCASMRKVGQAMRRDRTASGSDSHPLSDVMATIPEPERLDTLKEIDSLEKACASPNKENLEAWLRQQNDRSSRTCSIWVNTYEQTFTLQSAGVWVHSGQPDGICGAVHISTLEKEEGTASLWSYRTRKIITAKNALKENKLLNCKDLDEDEYFYTWKSKAYYRGCDYIKYGF